MPRKKVLFGQTKFFGAPLKTSPSPRKEAGKSLFRGKSLNSWLQKGTHGKANFRPNTHRISGLFLHFPGKDLGLPKERFFFSQKDLGFFNSVFLTDFDFAQRSRTCCDALRPTSGPRLAAQVWRHHTQLVGRSFSLRKAKDPPFSKRDTGKQKQLILWRVALSYNRLWGVLKSPQARMRPVFTRSDQRAALGAFRRRLTGVGPNTAGRLYREPPTGRI